jgi:hypothetical protein
MLNRAFWTATLERVLASIAGAVLALLTADGFDLLTADWRAVLSTAGLAGLASLLKALIASKVGDNPGPSLANEKVTAVNPRDGLH